MPIIQSVERALTILDLFDERDKELTITEISKRMDLHKSTVHSLIKTLQLHGYMKQNEENEKYSLGLKLFERGQHVIGNMDIHSIARKFLEQLSDQTGYTSHLVILDGQEGVYIDKVEGTGVTVLYSRIGRRVPIHTSAVGKALVAFKRDEEIEALLENYDFVKRTDNSICTKEAFLEELQNVRSNGYAVDAEENEPGIFCIAVPIKNHTGNVIAATSVSMSIAKASADEVDNCVATLKEVATQISSQLGYGYRGL